MTLAMIETEDQSLRAELLSDADDLLGWLAAGYAIAHDPPFQAILRRRAGVSGSAPLLVGLPETGAWIRLKRGGGAEIQRAPTPDLAQYRFDMARRVAVRRWTQLRHGDGSRRSSSGRGGRLGHDGVETVAFRQDDGLQRCLIRAEGGGADAVHAGDHMTDERTFKSLNCRASTQK